LNCTDLGRYIEEKHDGGLPEAVEGISRSSRGTASLVFILYEFFSATGLLIHAHGGWIDKFLGEGLLQTLVTV
jgi:hypothetical protein